MNRINKECCGDCAKCQLLASGEVEMLPCAIDQIFKRVQMQGEALARLTELVNKGTASSPALAAKIEKK